MAGDSRTELPPPPMQGHGEPAEMKAARLEWELQLLRRDFRDLQESVDKLNTEKEKAMRWGIMALGAAVLGMGTWIFNLIASKLGS